MGTIAKLQIAEFQALLKERYDSERRLSDEVVELLKTEGFSPLYGARPMTGAVEKHIIDPLARWILEQAAAGKKDVQGSLITVGVREGKISFSYEPRPAAEPERLSLQGAAQGLARQVLEWAEGVTSGSRSAPTEEEFDGLLRGLLSPPVAVGGGTSKVVSPPSVAARPFFNPGVAGPAALETGKKAVAAHNNPNQADDNMRYEIKKIKHTIEEAQWPESLRDLVAPPVSAVGVGWLKHFIRHAKESATKAGSSEPVRLESAADEDYIRLAVRTSHAMTPEEAALLAAHFTGPAPKSFEEAQAMADDRNLTSAMVWDHHLWDLYRRLSAVPGARFGTHFDGAGTEYWLELPKHGSAVDNAPPGAPIPTPHQAKWNSMTRELLVRMLRQDGVAQYEKDGPAVKVAAAAGFAALAGPEEARTVRAWIRDEGWSSRDTMKTRVTENWPLVMAAARVLERFGSPMDIPTVETLARKAESYEHIYVPLKGALQDTLAALYERAGPEEARKALEREKAENNAQIAAAARLALARIGTMDDREAVKSNPEALAALLGRLAPEDLTESVEDLWPPKVKADGSYESSAWTSHPVDRRIAVLAHVGRTSRRVKKDLPALLSIMSGKMGDDRPVKYAAAEAFAELAARENLLGGLQRNLEKYVEADSMTSYNNTDGWGLLLGMIYLLQRAGGPENLAALEEIMKKEPGAVQSVHEQGYFNTPLAWAKTVVRNGLFEEYAAPRRGDDGAEKPSKIQEMLTSTNPMFAAAALHAVVLAQAAAAGGGEAGPAKPKRPGPDASARLTARSCPATATATAATASSATDWMNGNPLVTQPHENSCGSQTTLRPSGVSSRAMISCSPLVARPVYHRCSPPLRHGRQA